MVLGRRIKEQRKLMGLTQKELGEIINVTKVSICCYEKGTRTPTLDTLLDLANALNVEFTYLLGNDDYIVADDDKSYGMNIAKDEMNLVKALRKHTDLYNKLIADPERIIKLIEQKIR